MTLNHGTRGLDQRLLGFNILAEGADADELLGHPLSDRIAQGELFVSLNVLFGAIERYLLAAADKPCDLCREGFDLLLVLRAGLAYCPKVCLQLFGKGVICIELCLKLAELILLGILQHPYKLCAVLAGISLADRLFERAALLFARRLGIADIAAKPCKLGLKILDLPGPAEDTSLCFGRASGKRAARVYLLSVKGDHANAVAKRACH